MTSHRSVSPSSSLSVELFSERDIDPFDYAIGILRRRDVDCLKNAFAYLWKEVGGYPYACESVYLFACHY
ncbi:MAG: hypothetical protein P0S94_03820, partial [Simkaniaceae bacterium]|nr:hypothetical protein [Simkaniaceae bacterium]